MTLIPFDREEETLKQVQLYSVEFEFNVSTRCLTLLSAHKYVWLYFNFNACYIRYFFVYVHCSLYYKSITPCYTCFSFVTTTQVQKPDSVIALVKRLVYVYCEHKTKNFMTYAILYLQSVLNTCCINLKMVSNLLLNCL